VSVVVYWQDHNSYEGMTLAKLRRIDPAIADISIFKTGKKTYCIETAVGDSHVFQEGLAGEVMLGTCNDPKGGKPSNPSQWIKPPDESSTPDYSLRYASSAIEYYFQDHNSYVGMTIAKLRSIDPGIDGISIVRAGKSSYCIESVASGSKFALRGPTRGIAPGSCAK
jgi:hypothetical protein